MTALTPQQIAQVPPDHRNALMRRGAFKMADPTHVPAAEQLPPADSGEFTLDLSNLKSRLSVGDAEDIELATGVGIAEFFQRMSKGRLAGLSALIWVMRRKDDPTFTLEQAKDLSITDVTAAFGVGKADELPLGSSSSESA